MMRRIAVIFAALALFLPAGCRQETVLPEPPASIRFTAEIGALTRTTLDGVRVLWEAGDELDILSGAGVVTYVATPDASDARKATFTKKNPSDPEPVPLPEESGLGSYAALYPSGLVTMTEGIPSITLPSTQQYRSPGSIKDMNVMFAATETLSFSFQNAMGLLELTIRGDKTLTALSVQTKETPIAGRVDPVTLLPTTGTGLTLDCGSGVALTPEGTRFYIGFPAVTVPLGELCITATASDGTCATLVNRGGAATFQAGHISPYTWTPVFEAPEGTDWYERFTSGQDLVIGGKTYNKATHPSCALVRLGQFASGAEFAAGYLDGQYDLVFIDTPAGTADRLTVSDANLAIADGVALVGRYECRHSELVFQGKGITPKGSLALKNVCVRTHTNALTTAAMTVSGSRIDIADCAFYITPNEGAAGSLVYDSKSTSPLGSFSLKNSVVVRRNDYNHALFRSSAYGNIPYQDFVIENNALVYTSDILGKEVCTSNLFALSTDSEAKNPALEFTFKNNSVLGYKGNGTVLATCDPKAIVCEDNVLEEKLTLAVYLFNIYYPYSKLSAQTSSVGGNYCNNSGSFVSGVDFANGDALKARFAVPSPNRFEYGLTPFSLIDTSLGYLGLIPSLAGKGCSYETKLWRDWATDAGGNSESYGEGHGSDEFGWQ